jgi:hypothetical protein
MKIKSHPCFVKLIDKNIDLNIVGKLSASKSALIIMDPWQNSRYEEKKFFFSKIIEKKLIPVIQKAKNLKIKIVVLTNSCNNSNYNCGIHNKVIQILKGYNDYEILYHQDFQSRDFGNHLIKNNIKNIIYTGFSSDECIIGRPMGIVTMKNSFPHFKYFFIPEASGSFDLSEPLNSGINHKIATKIINQYSEIIHFENFMEGF